MKNTMHKLALLLGVIAATTLSATAAPGDNDGPGKGNPGKDRGARGPRPVPAAVLEEFDTNKNGKLEPKEREAAAAARKAKWESMSEEERKEAMEKRRAAMEERRKQWQDMSPEDREKMMKERMMKRFDTNGNGKLEKKEQEAMDKAIEQMKERGGRRGGPEGRRGPGGPGKGGPGKGGPGKGGPGKDGPGKDKGPKG